MGRAVQLRRSERRSVLWNMHVVADGCVDRLAPRLRFLSAILGQLGVPLLNQPAIVRSVMHTLPDDLGGIDMGELLMTLGRAIPIDWIDDLKPCTAETRERTIRELTAIVTALPVGQGPVMPRPVAEEMVRALSKALGGELDDETAIVDAVERQLVSALWQRRGREQWVAEMVWSALEDAAKLRVPDDGEKAV